MRSFLSTRTGRVRPRDSVTRPGGGASGALRTCLRSVQVTSTVGIGAGLAVPGGERGGVEEGLAGGLAARGRAEEHVRARDVAGVQPQVAGAAVAEREVVVVRGGAADEDEAAVERR
jgi:hypothetical protein